IEGTIEALRQEQSSVESLSSLEMLKVMYENRMQQTTRDLLARWPELRRSYSGNTFVTRVRDKEVVTKLTTRSLSGLDIPKVSLPKFHDWGDLVRWMYRDNVPGEFPYTAGVFPFKRKEEDPKRQFAGEGTPER